MEKQLRNITSNLTAWLSAAALISILTSNPAWGLLLGSIIALFAGNPVAENTGKVSKKLLQISVILLGFGMHFDAVISVGLTSVWVTMISISFTLIIGTILGRMFGVERDLSLLLSTGTAICGGSAIAAVSPVIDATDKEVSVSLGVIFFLNSIALLLFPILGHFFDLTQYQFGLWSAIAIHDTSSVVGAASAYGEEALGIAVTVKLARTLWIIPVSLISAWFFRSKGRSISIPWFIALFILAILANTYLPVVGLFNMKLVSLARHALVVTLFLIGTSLSVGSLKSVGVKPFVLGIMLWIIVSVLSLVAILLLY